MHETPHLYELVVFVFFFWFKKKKKKNYKRWYIYYSGLFP